MCFLTSYERIAASKSAVFCDILSSYPDRMPTPHRQSPASRPAAPAIIVPDPGEAVAAPHPHLWAAKRPPARFGAPAAAARIAVSPVRARAAATPPAASPPESRRFPAPRHDLRSDEHTS